MDFSFLIIVVFMLLAASSGNTPIVLALFALLLVLAKNKILVLAAFVGLVLSGIAVLDLENKSLFILIGLFFVLILVAKSEPATPAPYMGGGYY
ncbi:MAG: hypothetical protein ABH863_06085 [Candidatus Micrarchaeota archaeon]